ncbi:MAG TPA: selenoneine synthase SenA [Thiobacillus sp.]
MNIARPISDFTADQLIDKLAQARAQLRALISHLPENGWLGPYAEHLNPPLWEAGHIVWFQERWCLRVQPDGSLAPSLLAGADALYDSSTVPHDTRWDLPLLKPAAVEDYAAQVTAAISARLRREFNPTLAYFAELSLVHELMHIEAWRIAFQDLGYSMPDQRAAGSPVQTDRLTFSRSEVTLGSGPHKGFIFDNEKWQHTVAVPTFNIDPRLISETEFAAFVDAGGYENSPGWSEAGWAWRKASDATHPVYWQKNEGAWQVRRLAEWMALNPNAPMLHINRFEAEACAAWMGRRLPTAAQWLRATQDANFHWGAGWEWMRNAFAPYPGFAADPYEDYSQPWFHTHVELRGGGPYTDALLKRTGYRNFYLPHRRDPFAGFRTVSAV